MKQPALTELGLLEASLQGLSLENQAFPEATIKALETAQAAGRDPRKIMSKIRGLDNPHKIKAIGLGLTRPDLAGHDWDEAGEITILGLKGIPRDIPIQSFMNTIRGKSTQDFYSKMSRVHQAKAMGILPTKDEGLFYNPGLVFCRESCEPNSRHRPSARHAKGLA